MNGHAFSLRSDTLGVWLSASAIALCLVLLLGLLVLLAYQGLGHFWPKNLYLITYQDSLSHSFQFIGEQVRTEWVVRPLSEQAQNHPSNHQQAKRLLFKIGNREGRDFQWLWETEIQAIDSPHDLVVIERLAGEDFMGYLEQIQQNGLRVESTALWQDLQPRLARARELRGQIHQITQHPLKSVDDKLEQLRLQERRWQLQNALTTPRQVELAQQRAVYQQHHAALQAQLTTLRQALQRDTLIMRVSDGSLHTLPLAEVVTITMPNGMTWREKLIRYGKNVWHFIHAGPRESNTKGGVFPAIFGTIMMVIIMSIFVTPFGVIAAIYLNEYARQNWLTRWIHIAVHNLAGVPSIVYGVFGLGFFVYGIGGTLDQLFFPEAAPAPVFGTGGILWASLTLALLTLPVVVVTTEEGLARIPQSIRQGSLALGATQAETLWRIVLPMASPSMMTGIILAIARASGEVAPLMLVGVVKVAPALPLDSEPPFIHLERKFMHLGFHLYDLGLQSPDVEAVRPLVFATALLLVMMVIILNLTAMWIRARLSERYRILESL